MLVLTSRSTTHGVNFALSMSCEQSEQSMLEAGQGGDQEDVSEWECLTERVLQQPGATYNKNTVHALQQSLLLYGAGK